LIGDGDNGAADEIHLAKAQWVNGLDVEVVRRRFVLRPCTEVGVVLQRQTDHSGEGILGLLGQFLIILRKHCSTNEPSHRYEHQRFVKSIDSVSPFCCDGERFKT